VVDWCWRLLSRRRGRGEVVGESGRREGRVGGGGRGCGEEGEKRGEDDVVVVVVVEGKREERTRRKSNVGGAGLARGVHGGWHKKEADRQQQHISTRDRRYVIHQSTPDPSSNDVSSLARFLAITVCMCMCVCVCSIYHKHYNQPLRTTWSRLAAKYPMLAELSPAIEIRPLLVR